MRGVHVLLALLIMMGSSTEAFSEPTTDTTNITLFVRDFAALPPDMLADVRTEVIQIFQPKNGS